MCNDCEDDDPCFDPCRDCHDCGEPEPCQPPNDCPPANASPIGLSEGVDQSDCETDWRNDIPNYGNPGIPGNPGDPGNPPPGTNPGGGIVTPGGPGTNPPPVVNPPVTGTPFRSAALSKLVTRNNCEDGKLGQPYNAQLAEGAFLSALSQADANNKAVTWLDAIAQREANIYGICAEDTSKLPYLSEVDWIGETGCAPGTTFAGVGWGWDSGVTDAACPAAPPRLTAVDWGETANCPTPESRIYGIEWAGTNCN